MISICLAMLDFSISPRVSRAYRNNKANHIATYALCDRRGLVPVHAFPIPEKTRLK